MPCCSNVSPSFRIFPANIRHTVETLTSNAFATSSLSYDKTKDVTVMANYWSQTVYVLKKEHGIKKPSYYTTN